MSQLTSVRVDGEMFEEFKINSIKYKFSLHKLTERSMYLFNTNPDFRKMLLNTQISKSTINSSDEENK